MEPNEETIKAERHEQIIKQVAKELSLSLKQVRTTSELAGRRQYNPIYRTLS